MDENGSNNGKNIDEKNKNGDDMNYRLGARKRLAEDISLFALQAMVEFDLHAAAVAQSSHHVELSSGKCAGESSSGLGCPPFVVHGTTCENALNKVSDGSTTTIAKGLAMAFVLRCRRVELMRGDTRDFSKRFGGGVCTALSSS